MQVPAATPADVDVSVLDKSVLTPVSAAGLGVKVTRRDGIGSGRGHPGLLGLQRSNPLPQVVRNKINTHP
ncbi:hypothetical protein ACWD9K_37495 [Streptomyces sp. 900116325]